MENRGEQFQDELVKLARRIREAEQNPPDPAEVTGIPDGSSDEADQAIRGAERVVKGDMVTLEKLTGIGQKNLPKADTMNESQQSFLYTELLRLLRAYGYEPDFPNGLPVIWKYKEIRKLWRKPQPYLGPGPGVCHLEFCDYEPANCPFPQTYCTCRDLNEPEDDDTGENDDFDDIF